MDDVLVNILLDQHDIGNHSPNRWKTPAYTAIVNTVQKELIQLQRMCLIMFDASGIDDITVENDSVLASVTETRQRANTSS